jgi:preprotein translocase subunit SecG
MRTETAINWIFVGFGLLAIGMLLYMFEVTEDGLLAKFLEIIGVVYFAIGMVLAVIHNKHMLKRMRAGRE